MVHLFRSAVGTNDTSLVDTIEHILIKIFNVIVINVSSLRCPLPNLNAPEKLAILHSVGYILLGFLGLLYIVTVSVFWFKRFIARIVNGPSDEVCSASLVDPQTPLKDSASSLISRIVSAFTYISLLMYSSSTQLCLSLLHCVPLGETQVLFLDGNIKCYQPFQYFLLAYVISSVLPFCLIPVLGSYLLKFDRISVKQFIFACIFPLPFCCYWIYSLSKDRLYQKSCDPLERGLRAVIRGGESIEGTSSSGELVTSDFDEHTSSALRVLVGPFRSHTSSRWFKGCPVPWEGFLIFRRLALIVVLTFVHDDRLKMMLVLTLCVAILISHVYVRPFQKSKDNLIESLSLSVLIVLCGLTMIKVLYYGEGSSPDSFSSLKCV